MTTQVKAEISELDALRAELASLKAELATQVAQAQAPRPTTVRKAGLMIKGIALANKPDHEHTKPLTRLTTASIANLERCIPLRLEAMGVKANAAALVRATPPFVHVVMEDGVEQDYGIRYGPTDWTDYYFELYK